MWSTLLGAFDIKYMPRTSVKGQVLADLVAEFAEPSVEALAEKENMDGKSVGTIMENRLEQSLHKEPRNGESIWMARQVKKDLG